MRDGVLVDRAKILLEARDLQMRFGGICALDALSFRIRAGGVIGVIGPNGAGKTTLFNCLSRFCAPQSGDLLFEGRSILKRAPHEMAGLGIGRTFQNLALFPALSVRDNVKIGAHARGRAGFLAAALRTPAHGRCEREFGEIAAELLAYFNLEAIADRPAGHLPFGWRKRVELARALAARPKLLLLDEPASGLNEREACELSDLIHRIRAARATTIFLVEHRMSLVQAACDHVIALNFGRKIAEGPPKIVCAHEDVVAAYLGGAVD